MRIRNALTDVLLDMLLAELLDQGWRRSGKFLYKVCALVLLLP
jgi:arginyl-tRNA--protein-N-Asp/Glu arginylyltransferase